MDKRDLVITNIFYNKPIFSHILSFLNEDNQKTLKGCFKRSGMKERKKQLKDIVKYYIEDFGKHQEKLKFKINENKHLAITTNIFNVNKNYLRNFIYIFHQETGDKIELEKHELYEYLKVLPKMEFYLQNEAGDTIRVSKGMIPYDIVEEDQDEEGQSEAKKYEMFYQMNDLSTVDFSNKEELINRQKKMLEMVNAQKETIFYPLQFVSTVNYWSIVLCHGGYFAAGFFLRDKLLEHKSDHKYVTRKKAGQRQVNKDKAKKVRTSGI